MKLILLTLLCCLLNEVSLQNYNYTASLNKIIDEVTANIRKSGVEIGLEPLKLDDIHGTKEGEEYDLTNGLLFNAISVQRFEETEASYTSGVLKIVLGFNFQNLKTEFDFKAKIFGLNPEGNLTAIIPDLSAKVVVDVDAINVDAHISELLVPTVGDIQVQIQTTVPIYGKAMELLIKYFTTLFQDEIVYAVGKVLQTVLNDLIKQIVHG